MADPNVPATTPSTKPAPQPTGFMGGAVGAGSALVVLPCIALLLLGVMNNGPQAMPSTLTLAMVAIFGIMILLGAMALVSTLFARLDLANAGEAMGLPAGSIRAFIALALIVLFALISVMLYQCVSQTYRIDDLTDAERAALVKDPANHVTAIVPRACTASSPAPCGGGTTTVYTAYVRQAPGSESTDLAKQLLILIGTLMTSVTSFYFASRAGEATTKTAMAALASHLTGKDSKPTDGGGGGGGDDAGGGNKPDGQAPAGLHDHVDGCDVAVETPTDDKDLPPSTGGVAS